MRNPPSWYRPLVEKRIATQVRRRRARIYELVLEKQIANHLEVVAAEREAADARRMAEGWTPLGNGWTQHRPNPTHRWRPWRRRTPNQGERA